jgi:hypothetical protein
MLITSHGGVEFILSGLLSHRDLKVLVWRLGGGDLLVLLLLLLPGVLSALLRGLRDLLRLAS